MDRLYNWPLLRQLKAERRFRYAFGVCSLAFIVILLSIPKIWIVTPKGVNPTIRVRGIDFMEARLFEHIALSKERSGDRATAWQYWRQACAHSPVSTRLLKRALENVWELPARNYAYYSDGMAKASSLLALDHDRTTAIRYAVHTFSHFRFFPLVLKVVSDNRNLDQETAVLALQATLWTGDKASYIKLRPTIGVPPGAPELRLYDLALLAAWGERPTEAAEARRQLLDAAKNPDLATRFTAQKLLLLTGSQRSDVRLFEDTLQSLHDEAQDEPLQHVLYWHLLEETGQRERAIDAAKKAELVPVSSTEILGVAEAFERLDMKERAVGFIDRFAMEKGGNADVWLHYTDLLISRKEWDELRRAVLDIRRAPAVRAELSGYSHFLEGLAMQASGVTQEAESNFRMVPQLTIPRHGLALLVAGKMFALRSVEPALQLALQHEEALAREPKYWTLLVDIARYRKDASLLLRAARSGSALEPDNPYFLNNYISALIISETSPEDLLTLAARQFDADPGELPARLNYALALIYNHRTNDAARLVLTIPQRNYSPVEQTIIALTRGRLETLRQNWPAAHASYNDVDLGILFPSQAEKVIKLREEASVEADRAGLHNQVP